MLSIREISRFYPATEQVFGRNILREYLQYKVLEIIFNSTQGAKLSFIGGTALRVIYGAGRFSEDLDFDNFGLTITEFRTLASQIQKKLTLEGHRVETEVTAGRAWRCRIKLTGAFFRQGLSAHTNERLLVQLDTNPHSFNYSPDTKIINKFDIFTQINVTPPSILLSQKIYAAFNRPRLMGRDFYDLVFLFALTQPNYGYLKAKLNISQPTELKAYLTQKARGLDFNKLADDVEPFLINSEEKRRVALFPAFLADLNL